jgi:hypothetical protein
MLLKAYANVSNVLARIHILLSLHLRRYSTHPVDLHLML